METSDWKEKEHFLRESLKLKSIKRREEILCKDVPIKKKTKQTNSKHKHATHARVIFLDA